MFGRKTKTPVEQPIDRRRVRSGSSTPAFSYYTSRISEPPQERTPNRRPPQQPEAGQGQAQGRPPRRSFLARLPFWLLVALVAVCVVKILLLSSSPKIVVVGKSQVASSYMQSSSVYAAAVSKLLSSSIANRCKLTVDTGEIAQALKQEFPELIDVSVNVPLVGNRPVVYVQPASPTLVLQTTHGNFALNNSGVVLTSLNTVPSNVPEVVDQSGLSPRPGKQVLSGDTVTFAQTVAYQFAAAHLTISTFVLPANSPYELDVRLEGKPYAIRFNLEEDALTQSGEAIATLQQLGSTVPANYVDVRVPGRVYYK